MERRAALKAKFRSRAPIFAAWTSFYHPGIAEIFSMAGVDFVGIDIEHSPIDIEQARDIIAACQSHGVCCLPRVASHNGETIRRLLDAGADGVIVPQVATPAEVAQLAEWIKYPPEGKRGFGVARAQGYGFDFADYTSQWNAASCLVIQIESMAGVGNIDALVSHPAVDAAMVGPYDLSGSLGVPGQLDHPRLKEAAAIVVAACASHGRACGTQDTDPSPDSVRAAKGAGYNFVVLASDIFILWKWAERMRELTAAMRTPPDT